MRDIFFAAFMDEMAKIASSDYFDPAEPTAYRLGDSGANKGRAVVEWGGTPIQLAAVSKAYGVKPEYDKKTNMHWIQVPMEKVHAYRRKMKRVK